MQCPVCKGNDLVPVMTRQGVKVDSCRHCEGIWLDRNEIYLFTRTPTYLKAKIEEALKSARTSSRLSPATGEPLKELSLADGELTIDYCPGSGGIWLDKEEINKLPAIKARVDIDKGVLKPGPAPVKSLFGLPNLSLNSGMVLFSLYAVLTLFLITAVELEKISASLALIMGVTAAALHFIFGPFLMDLSLRFLFKVRWVKPEDLPVHLTEFISRVSNDKRIEFPRIGIIDDGSPNAFTYGHHPNNARIVLTQGLLDLLTPLEAEAVVAHEIGHAVHWDMLVMTLAQLVPLVLYYIYKTLVRMKSRGRDKSAPYRYLIAVAAYVLYIVSEYIVLWFSRLREYFADRFSGEVTGNPDALAQALVKIGYGLAGEESKMDKDARVQRKDTMSAIGALGIFDSKAGQVLAVSGYLGPRNMGGLVDKEKLKEAARWELWNPWAGFYELQSTHPLISKRLRFLSNQSRFMGREPYIEFDEARPESYWDEFIIDVTMKFLPFLAIILSVGYAVFRHQVFFLFFGFFTVGATYLLLLLFSYPNRDFADMTVVSLLSKVKTSAVRPVPCKIKGKIIGRGVPGLIFSDDFILQDESGIMFLDYRQPLGVIEFFFGLLRAREYIGKDAEITGWYRRSPMPYIEMKKMKIDGKESVCYAYHAKLLLAIGIMLAGIYFCSQVTYF